MLTVQFCQSWSTLREQGSAWRVCEGVGWEPQENRQTGWHPRQLALVSQDAQPQLAGRGHRPTRRRRTRRTQRWKDIEWAFMAHRIHFVTHLELMYMQIARLKTKWPVPGHFELHQFEFADVNKRTSFNNFSCDSNSSYLRLAARLWHWCEFGACSRGELGHSASPCGENEQQRYHRNITQARRSGPTQQRILDSRSSCRYAMLAGNLSAWSPLYVTYLFGTVFNKKSSFSTLWCNMFWCSTPWVRP